MKLENPGYRLNQRLDKGAICGIFQWKGKITSHNASYQLGVGKQLLGTKDSSTTKKRCLIETKEAISTVKSKVLPLLSGVGPFSFEKHQE